LSLFDQQVPRQPYDATNIPSQLASIEKMFASEIQQQILVPTVAGVEENHESPFLDLPQRFGEESQK
jgi:hypothetical protein